MFSYKYLKWVFKNLDSILMNAEAAALSPLETRVFVAVLLC